jgi:ADP-ribose pyrophosphatase YjhB (NUDIX family)
MTDKKLKNRQGLTEEEFLAAYDANMYERPSVTVDMLIFTVADEEKENYRKLPGKVLKVLMVKRGDHPCLGQWALPGGFVSVDESVDHAALRELKEETNIDRIYIEQLYTWGDVGRDPRTRIISCSYMSLADSSLLDVKAGDDADDAKWFTVKSSLYQEQKTVTGEGLIQQKLVNINLSSGDENLTSSVKITRSIEGKAAAEKREIVESGGIAFDHAKIIEYGIERLRRKIEYTDLAFNLMPELFTLTELQQVYEVILGRELLKANFRRKVADMVLETDNLTKDAGHRPSKLYRYNPDWKEKEF